MICTERFRNHRKQLVGVRLRHLQMSDQKIFLFRYFIEQRSDQRGLTRPWLAGYYDKTLAFQNAIAEEREDAIMAGATKYESRIRREIEGLIF